MKPAYTVERSASAAPDADRLIAGVLAGDARAERALYRTHVDRVHRVTLRMTRDEELARELTQQTFSRAFERLSSFRGDSAFTTWLHRVAVNTALSGLEKAGRIREVEQELDPSVPCGSAGAEADPLLRDRVREAIAALPKPYRVVLVMHEIEGFNHHEIARALNIAPGTSKARLFRARALLRPVLARCAVEYATC
jgi:RNA polymerase sigma-70 factor, ECF subfamily